MRNKRKRKRKREREGKRERGRGRKRERAGYVGLDATRHARNLQVNTCARTVLAVAALTIHSSSGEGRICFLTLSLPLSVQ